MKRARIGSVHVRGVRGVRETVKLELGERGLLLRGDNGTGKSSIVDGLRWALLGEMPPAKGEDFRTHLRAQGACEIAIDLTPRGKIVFRDGALDEEATTEEGLELVEHCRRSRPFLRRAELLDLLQGSASDRFQYLAKFFDLAAVDTLEQDLAKGTRERRTRMEELEREARRRLESIVAPIPWAQAGPDRVEDVDRHARAEGARLGLAREGESATISDLMVRAAASRGSGAQSRRRSELHAAATEADKLVPPDAPKTALEPLRSAESAATENGLQSLLESALAHLEHHPDRAACPVCEQATSPTNGMGSSAPSASSRAPRAKPSPGRSPLVDVSCSTASTAFRTCPRRSGSVSRPSGRRCGPSTTPSRTSSEPAKSTSSTRAWNASKGTGRSSNGTKPSGHSLPRRRLPFRRSRVRCPPRARTSPKSSWTSSLTPRTPSTTASTAPIRTT